MNVQPTNATVLIDDNLKQTTAEGTLVAYMPYGKYKYRVLAEGYKEESGTVTVGHEKTVLNVTLEQARATLTVTCPTPSSEIYINNSRVGTSPWSGALAAGWYNVEAKRAGYHSSSASVTLSENDSRTVTLPALAPISGSINVNYIPTDAEIWLDGKQIGTTPDVFRKISLGTHRLEIKKSGYETKALTVNLNEEKTIEITGSLTKAASKTTTPSAQAKAVPTVPTNTDNGKDVRTFHVGDVSFKMIKVQGGTFTMGADLTDTQGTSWEYPRHKVTLSTYYIGQTEVTQALWQAVMGNNPSKFVGENNPVEQVSWEDCRTFIRKLNELTGANFSLPTEAEWEYAARGGQKSKQYRFSGSNNISNVAWYMDNAGSTHNVATKPSNELDLYDMTGNVWEWCSDWLGNYPSAAQTNPTGATYGINRVMRGGSWHAYRRGSRISNRYSETPSYKYSDLGLRLVLRTEAGSTTTAQSGTSSETTNATPTTTISQNQANSVAMMSRDDYQSFTVKGTTFNMIKVEGGTFTMGASSIDTEALTQEKPAHMVTLSTYYIGQTEVTQALWKAVMGYNPSKFVNPANPVENVTWAECQDFISKLNDLTGEKFSLPTEAQWEFAARGGTKSLSYKYSGSHNIDVVAWSNGCHTTHKVATKRANELDLYDMSGNVWEWCSNTMDFYSATAQTDPTGPTTGSDHVIRGGSWMAPARSSRVSCRYGTGKINKAADIGFRLALQVSSK